MIKIIMYKKTKIISAFILTAIVFAFLHSEAGLLDYDDSNHGTHDYCYLVDNVTVQSAKIPSDLPQLKVETGICFHCIQETVTNEILITAFEYKDFLYWPKTSELYLYNRVFLI